MSVVGLYLLALITTVATHKLGQYKGMNHIRSSCLVTIVMVLATTSLDLIPTSPQRSGLIFAASFLGMVSPRKASLVLLTLGPALLLALIKLPSVAASQLGGTLGLCAFLSCLLLHTIVTRVTQFNKSDS